VRAWARGSAGIRQGGGRVTRGRRAACACPRRGVRRRSDLRLAPPGQAPPTRQAPALLHPGARIRRPPFRHGLDVAGGLGRLPRAPARQVAHAVADAGPTRPTVRRRPRPLPAAGADHDHPDGAKAPSTSASASSTSVPSPSSAAHRSGRCATPKENDARGGRRGWRSCLRHPRPGQRAACRTVTWALLCAAGTITVRSRLATYRAPSNVTVTLTLPAVPGTRIEATPSWSLRR
jgi:hypothetical protein